MAYSTEEQLTRLMQRRDWILNKLAGLDETKVGGKADSGGAGSTVGHVSFRMSLYNELNMINSEIVRLEGPVEVEHLGVPV
jgi:hypothetical protein